MNYLVHSDISARISVNPINWIWLPKFKYTGPSEIQPSCRTLFFGFLFLQLFLNIDNGIFNEEPLRELFIEDIDIVDEEDNDYFLKG